MTLMETKVVLEDGISVGGKELREIYEVRISGAGHVPPVGNGWYLSQKKIDWIITMPWKPMRYEESSENLQI